MAGQLEAALQLGEQNHIAQGGQPTREGEGGSAAAQEFSRLLEQLKQAVLWIRSNYLGSGFDFSEENRYGTINSSTNCKIKFLSVI